MLVTADTATLPEPLDTNALEAVKSVSSIVVAAPVIVACLAFNCVSVSYTHLTLPTILLV